MINSLLLYIVVVFGFLWFFVFFLEMSDELVLKIIKHEEEDDVVDEKALKDFDQYLHHFRVSKHSKEKKIMDIQNSSNGSGGGGNTNQRTHINDETIRYYDSDSPITME